MQAYNFFVSGISGSKLTNFVAQRLYSLQIIWFFNFFLLRLVVSLLAFIAFLRTVLRAYVASVALEWKPRYKSNSTKMRTDRAPLA